MRREIVRSRSNPHFGRLAALKQRARGAEGLLLVEGPTLLEEALAAGVAVVEAAISETGLAGERGRALCRALERERVPVRVLEDRLVAALSEVETSQGVLAVARPPVFDEARILHGNALVLVAVGIQNPGNLGGLIRSAEAAGATGAWLSEGTADPLSWKSLRGSMGSAFRLPHRRGVPLATLLAQLEARGVATVASDPRAGLRYDQADLRRPAAILVGGEAAGLPAALLEAASLRVSIPLAPPVESLNVSVAAGILLFEAARQRRGAEPR